MLNNLMEHIPDAIWFKDVQSRFVAVSRALVLKHGLNDKSEILGKTDFDFFSADVASRFYEEEQEIIVKGVPVLGEEVAEDWQDGKRSWALVNKMPLKDKDGKIIGTFGIAHDITRRKKTEEELLRMNNELIEADAAKDRMMSILAHDLKNPFTTITGLTEMLKDEAGLMDRDTIFKLSSMVYNSSTQLFALLNQLLDWLKSGTKTMEFNPKTLNLYHIAEDVGALLLAQSAVKQINILNTVPPDTKVFADQFMIQTILRNLIGNAVKYSHPGGEIVVDYWERAGEGILSVKDSGVGIPNKKLDTLFEIDKIQSTPGTREEKGSGLGLLICKEFSERHGGSIRVESQAGAGTTFFVAIPIARIPG